jgi:hypothetical protein
VPTDVTDAAAAEHWWPRRRTRSAGSTRGVQRAGDAADQGTGAVGLDALGPGFDGNVVAALRHRLSHPLLDGERRRW